jgi:tRNA (guanine-N7-)-methyltransferase
MTLTPSFKRIVSLARKRTKNPEKEAKTLHDFLPQFAAIVPEDGGHIGKISDIFLTKQYNNNILEIGFGSGEHALVQAKNNPEHGYIGCEVFTGGVVKLLEGIIEEQLENIRIWHDDALALVSRLPTNSLDLVYILHPDPWPKTRHHKRRLINVEFLQLLSNKMAPGKKLLIVTDHKDYSNHIDIVVDQVTSIFERQFDNYPEVTKTKYRLKAEAKGIESNYFYLVRK